MFIKSFYNNFTPEMGKILNKYLLFFGITLIVGVIDLNANSAIQDYSSSFIQEIKTAINQEPNNIYLESTSLSSSKQKKEREVFFEITEIQEIKKEESLGKSDFLSFGSCPTNFLTLQLGNNSSFYQQRGLKYDKNFFDRSATKLHVRLQVFII